MRAFDLVGGGHHPCVSAGRPATSFVLGGMSYILGGVEEKPIGDAEDLEAGRGPVALVRPGIVR